VLIKEAAAGRPIVVAGSLVERCSDKGLSEDEMVIQAWEGRVRSELGALLVLAPRHPERFGLVESVVMEFRYARASDGGNFQVEGRSTPLIAKSAMNGPPGMSPKPGERLEIFLLDTIGDLAAVYGIADVAFVGGSLVKQGGHNPLEPVQFGVPAVMGPSYENFRGIVGKMKDACGISIVGEVEAGLAKSQDRGLSTALRSGRDDKVLQGQKNADSGRDDKVLQGQKNAESGQNDRVFLVEELENELVRLLTDREAARAMGERGRQVFEAEQGATGRAVEAIVAMVQP
jgi:3-deoxy-D-manno-octulosonic-acid transferase